MENAKHLFLNSRDELFRVDITKIAYFEADGNYTKFQRTLYHQGNRRSLWENI